MTTVNTIAEIGQAHDGSLGILHSYIDAISKTGVDAIKFQTHIASAESSRHEPFRVNFSYEDRTRFDYWRRMEFLPEQWEEIKNHCNKVGLEFISSPFSIAAVDLLENVGVSRYKIGSGDTNNLLLLKKVASTGKDMIISSGLSNFRELDTTISFLQSFGNKLSVLQCTTAYPTEPSQWGLNVIGELKSRYKLPVGFSDHSGEIYACLAAVALGVEILEFHVVFDKQMFGPDSKSSLTLNQTKQLITGIKQVNQALEHPIDKSDDSQFQQLKSIFGKSLAVNKDLPAGHILTENDLETKKPLGLGISAADYKEVIGKRLKKDLKQWSFLNSDDIIR